MTARFGRFGAPVLCALALAAWPAALEAQSTTGTLLGTVTDSAGGVLVGATVTATQRDTGFTRSLTTDAAGAYAFSYMPLGRYQVKVERDGFKAKIAGPVTLIVDQKLRTDFVLELGQMQEVHEVSGAATLLQTDQPDVNQIVQEKEIKALPLNGRDFFSLLLLGNGVQDTSNDQGGATTNVTFSVNGARPEANSVTLDGVQMSSVRESDVDLRPNVDAISEFKVLTSVYSAEYGHTAGGVISIQTKGGTNALHGTAFEFLRNDALNAANYFKNPVDPEKAPLKQNQFGFTLGGPIRKDRTFFFVDYQGLTVRKGTEAFAQVPEEPFRRGDFSSLLPGTVIYDPATGGTVPFPGNIIPEDRWDQFGWTLLNMVDLPNLPADYPLGNYFVRQNHRVDGHEGGFRVDHVISDADRVFLRFRMNNSQLFTSDAMSRPDGPVPGLAKGTNDDSRGIIQGGIHNDRNYNAVLSHVHLFSPRLVNEARVGFHRYELDVESNAHGKNLAEANGLHGVNRDDLSSGLPLLYMDAYTFWGGDDWKPLYFRNTFWQFNDTVTWSAGRHTFKLGAEYIRRTENDYFVVWPAGSFYVGTYATSQNLSWSQGHELASLLLGYPSYGYLGQRFGNHVLEDRQYAGFLQDDWKVTDKVVLNLGVRYDYGTPFFSPTNELSMFDVDQAQLVIAGQNGVSRYIVPPDKNNFATRLGVTYQPNPKTSLRGGFGVFYTPETAKRDEVRHNPPFYRAGLVLRPVEVLRSRSAAAARARSLPDRLRHLDRRQEPDNRLFAAVLRGLPAGAAGRPPLRGGLRGLTIEEASLRGEHQPGAAGRDARALPRPRQGPAHPVDRRRHLPLRAVQAGAALPRGPVRPRLLHLVEVDRHRQLGALRLGRHRRRAERVRRELQPRALRLGRAPPLLAELRLGHPLRQRRQGVRARPSRQLADDRRLRGPLRHARHGHGRGKHPRWRRASQRAARPHPPELGAQR
jgi:Carboxypeptidase regulatory-like domain/TonB dependent receptor-like, beta-barrel/TonB-dependent Receptor Plug Domain